MTRACSPRAFDDEGARNGWCLFEVGCKGPVTYNACATLKWNGGVVLPDPVRAMAASAVRSPDFWDRGGFYKPLSASVMGNRRSSAARRSPGSRRARPASHMARKRRAEAQSPNAARGEEAMSLAGFCPRPGTAGRDGGLRSGRLLAAGVAAGPAPRPRTGQRQAPGRALGVCAAAPAASGGTCGCRRALARPRCSRSATAISSTSVWRSSCSALPSTSCSSRGCSACPGPACPPA